MSAPVVPWITTAESVVGAGHPTLADVANRVIRFILTKCGIDVDTQGFWGLVPAVNARTYGAVGNGTTDDTAALQAMLDAMGTLYPKGCRAVVPPGDYKVTAPLIPAANNAFIDSSKHTVEGYGARLKSYDATPGRSILKFSSFIGQEGHYLFRGFTLDGTNATATTDGVDIHCGNVKLDRMVVRYCNKGVTYTFDLAAPPICSEIASCLLQLNTIGLNAAVPASVLYAHGNRIEGNDEEGVVLDNCGQVCFVGNTIETNGFVTASKNQMKIRNSVNGLFDGNYFESYTGQIHTCVDVEGNSSAVFALVFTANRFVSGGSTGDPLSIGLNLGSTAGAVESVFLAGNEFVGQTVGIRIGVNCRAFDIRPNYFTDNFDPAGTAHTRIQNNSVWTGSYDDTGRYSSTRYFTGRLKKRIIALAYSASITPDAELSNWFLITANNAVAFAINAPTHPPAATEEQELEFTIKNTSGGALGAITWNAIFKMAAWASPATGFNRSIRFRWTGAAWTEMARTAADIAN